MTFSFFVKNVSSQPFTSKIIEMNDDSIVFDLKMKIYSIFKLPTSYQLLSYNTKYLLNDAEYLSFYGVGQDCVVTVDSKFDYSNKDLTSNLDFVAPTKMSKNIFEQFKSTLQNDFTYEKLQNDKYRIINKHDNNYFEIVIENNDNNSNKKSKLRKFNEAFDIITIGNIDVDDTNDVDDVDDTDNDDINSNNSDDANGDDEYIV